MDIVVPVYMLSQVQAVIDQARRGTQIWAICNPDSGPGRKAAVPGWLKAVRELRTAGAKVGWYLDLKWWVGDAGWSGPNRDKTADELLAEYERYLRCYLVRDLKQKRDVAFAPDFWFLDDLAASPVDEKGREVNQAIVVRAFKARVNASRDIWGNPGCPSTGWQLRGIDYLMTWEAEQYHKAPESMGNEAHIALNWRGSASDLWDSATLKRAQFIYGTNARDNLGAYDRIWNLFPDLCRLQRVAARAEGIALRAAASDA